MDKSLLCRSITGRIAVVVGSLIHVGQGPRRAGSTSSRVHVSTSSRVHVDSGDCSDYTADLIV